MSDPNERQVGGDHYQSPIQHWDLVSSRDMSYLGGQITKYVARWRKKNGIQDLQKAAHFLDKLIDVSRNPIAPISIGEYLDANGDLGAEEQAIIALIATFDDTGSPELLSIAKMSLERLLLAAGGPPG
jgi:hypothetical protein